MSDPIHFLHTVKPTLNNIWVDLTHICQHLHYKLLRNFYLVWFPTSICCTHPTLLPTRAHLLHLTGTISFFNHLSSYLVKTVASVRTTADLILLFLLPLRPRALPFLPGLAASSKATEPAGANTEELNQWLFSSYPMQFKVLRPKIKTSQSSRFGVRQTWLWLRYSPSLCHGLITSLKPSFISKMG